MSTKKETPVVKVAEAVSMAYIGPTIPGVVIAGTVFNNGYPEKLKEEMRKETAIRKLLIPVKHLVKARQEMKRPGSAVQVCYERVKEAKR